MTDSPRRSSPVSILAVTCIVLVLILGLVAVVAVTRAGTATQAAKDARSAAVAVRQEVRRQDVLLTKINEVAAGLQTANDQRSCTAQSQSLAFATILDLLGDAFNTPPAPDPDRATAVQGFHDTANAFRSPAATTCDTKPAG